MIDSNKSTTINNYNIDHNNKNDYIVCAIGSSSDPKQ